MNIFLLHQYIHLEWLPSVNTTWTLRSRCIEKPLNGNCVLVEEQGLNLAKNVSKHAIFFVKTFPECCVMLFVVRKPFSYCEWKLVYGRKCAKSRWILLHCDGINWAFGNWYCFNNSAGLSCVAICIWFMRGELHRSFEMIMFVRSQLNT